MPGTGEIVVLGNDWLSRAQTAYNDAIKACIYEESNRDLLAGEAGRRFLAQPCLGRSHDSGHSDIRFAGRMLPSV